MENKGAQWGSSYSASFRGTVPEEYNIYLIISYTLKSTSISAKDGVQFQFILLYPKTQRQLVHCLAPFRAMVTYH